MPRWRARAAADETSQRTRTPLSTFSGAPERRFLENAGDEDIVLWREKEELEDGIGRTVRVSGIARKYVVHSPDGFEWGYGGSGPADLALNILARFLPAADAWDLHHAFKREFVATLPRQGGVILAKSVRQWIAEMWAARQPQDVA
jgi:hypothetical protein